MGRRPQQPRRALTREEQEALERLVTARSARRDQVQRATAWHAVAPGPSDTQAAPHAGDADADRVSRVVRRFQQRGLGAVGRAPGRGRNAPDEAHARARSVATAQRTPDREREGTATWSLSTRERAVRQQGWPPSGAPTMRRVLRAAGRS